MHFDEVIEPAHVAGSSVLILCNGSLSPPFDQLGRPLSRPTNHERVPGQAGLVVPNHINEFFERIMGGGELVRPVMLLGRRRESFERLLEWCDRVG